MIASSISGYEWPNGMIGVRNHVVVVSIMDNVNALARAISSVVPATVALAHPYGRAQLGSDKERHLSTMASLISHPNVAGAVLVSLEPSHALAVIERTWLHKPIESVILNECDGFVDALAKGISAAARLATQASQRRRVQISLSRLQLAVECGGSDATSGAVSNRIVGRLTDWLVGQGGTVVMSEPSEWIGAEDVLRDRARTPAVGESIVRVAQSYERYAIDQGVDLRGVNPSPDNMAGGISTIEEKSLGSIAKAGTSTVEEVLDYGCRPTGPGLAVMDAPAAGVENVTALVAGGSHLCVFTTGGGNPAGNPIAPVVRVSANPRIADSGTDVDISLSDVWQGVESQDDGFRRLADYVCSVADGTSPLSEVFRGGEIAISRCGFSL